MKALPWLVLVACTRKDGPAQDTTDTGFSCGDADALCEDYEADSASFALDLPTEGTVWWTEWLSDCADDEGEARALHRIQDYWASQPTPGMWFDFVWGEPYLRRVPDCAFITWTSFPDHIANDEGEEVAGLPVGWRFAEGTDVGKVEELVLGVEVSWAWRFGVECGEENCLNLVYDWTSWEEDGLTRWTFCNVFNSDYLSVQECHEYAYDPEAQVLGGLVTQGTEQLECFPTHPVDW